jgi:DNA recombination protein RmuC
MAFYLKHWHNTLLFFRIGRRLLLDLNFLIPLSISLIVVLVLIILLVKANKANAVLNGQFVELSNQTEMSVQQKAMLEANVLSLTQKLDSKQSDLIEIQQQLASEKAHVQGVNTRIQERDAQIAELKQNIHQQQQENKQLQQANSEILNEFTELKTSLQEKQHHFEQQKQDIEQQKQQLKTEFTNLANEILEQKGKSFSESNKTELDALLKPFKEQIEGFQKRVNEVHSESVKGQAGLAAELKKVLDVGVQMSDEANNLATALKGEKKTAGNWGEIQLERTLQLAGLVKGDHYDTQDKHFDSEGNRRLPDFVIKLPDEKHIIIDSKVSLVAYDKAIAAETEAELQLALDEHVAAVKNHIDDLYKKDYSNLVGMRSPSFVLMFMPIEPAYIEALKHKKDLFNYGYDKNVVLVSHTTLMPILKTVANLWRIEKGNAEAREISERAGEIYNQVCVVAERLQKLGKTLNTVSNQYNDTVKGLAGKQGLAGKVERFTHLSNKITKQMPQLEAHHADFEHERLELVAEKIELEDDRG